ncbi:dixin-like [Delphinapterus leucas]|uniref:Dixin-like n=1 Tax=Delphinapterus leucas TaxID=9749 RepID=A0A7F8K2H6_DELLE|nr:dixin-like [Delphinapterus leucas]
MLLPGTRSLRGEAASAEAGLLQCLSCRDSAPQNREHPRPWGRDACFSVLPPPSRDRGERLWFQYATIALLPPFIFQQQLQAYVAWVNAQLKKRPAVKPVQDLRQDLRDGVILAYLIEIVAGEKLSGVQLSPSNQQEMKNNVEKVLQFVASKKIRMHQTSAKDIVEGNLKSIMRLVLALAAHFKPGSSRTVNQGQDARAPLQSHQPHCATAVAQGAAAALADVCHDMSRSGRDIFRYRQRNSSVDEEIGNPCWSVRALVQQYEGQQRSPSESSCSR